VTEPYLNTVMSWLVARARTIERETVEAGRPLSIGLAQGLALMHAPDEPDLERLMTARMRSNDSTDVINDLQLRTDLARLKTGWRPDEHDLAEAPHLRVGGIIWTPFVRPWSVSLVGAVLDANGSPTGRQRITSFLIAADAREGKWARTWNRFYRLDDTGIHRAENDQ
jgi:hypothetical protein